MAKKTHYESLNLTELDWNCQVWRPVKGFEGIYEISNFGNVRSLGRYVDYRNGAMRYLKPRRKSVRKDKDGYCVVTFNKDKKGCTRFVHRMMAEAFIPMIPGKNEVNHIDEDKANNDLDNLEWVTHKENMMHGTLHFRKGLKARKPVDKFDTEGNFLETFGSVTEAALNHGVSIQAISRACRGKSKTSNGYRWEYHEGREK
jgi:hypothetical protein